MEELLIIVDKAEKGLKFTHFFGNRCIFYCLHLALSRVKPFFVNLVTQVNDGVLQKALFFLVDLQIRILQLLEYFFKSDLVMLEILACNEDTILIT